MSKRTGPRSPFVMASSLAEKENVYPGMVGGVGGTQGGTIGGGVDSVLKGSSILGCY